MYLTLALALNQLGSTHWSWTNRHAEIAEPRIAGQFSFGTHIYGSCCSCICTAAIWPATSAPRPASTQRAYSLDWWCVHSAVPKETYPVIHAQQAHAMPCQLPLPRPGPVFFFRALIWRMCLRLDLVYIARHGTAYAPSPGTIPPKPFCFLHAGVCGSSS